MKKSECCCIPDIISTGIWELFQTHFKIHYSPARWRWHADSSRSLDLKRQSVIGTCAVGFSASSQNSQIISGNGKTGRRGVTQHLYISSDPQSVWSYKNPRRWRLLLWPHVGGDSASSCYCRANLAEGERTGEEMSSFGFCLSAEHLTASSKTAIRNR